MPFPEDYTRDFGFASFQETHPQSPLPGDQVDVEFDAVEKSTDQIIAFIKRFARSDGRLANGSVGVDQLAPDLSIGFKAPTTWESGVLYVVGDTVFYANKFYTCEKTHTSGSIFTPEYWSIIVDFGAQADAAAASAASAAASAAVTAGVGEVVGIAALRALPALLLIGARVTVHDYVAGDGAPSRTYKCVSVDPGYPDDGGYVVASSSTPNRWWVLQAGRTLDIRWWGAKMDDGATSSAAEFTALKNFILANNAMGGKRLYFSGKLAVDTAAWNAYGSLYPCTGTTWFGDGWVGEDGQGTWFRLDGDDAVTEGIVFKNASKWTLRDIEFVGNGKGGGGNQRFIFITMDDDATGDCTQARIRRCRFRNFQNDNWVAVFNGNTAGFDMVGYEISGCDVVTATGNDAHPGESGHTSVFSSVQGNSGGWVRNVRIFDNTGDGTYVKSFAVCWSYVNGYDFFRNTLQNFGAATTGSDVYCYTAFAYDLGSTGVSPLNVNYYDNIITGCRSTGIYTACDTEINGWRNYISGQNDTGLGLPHAGISLNGSCGHWFENTVEDCINGIFATGSDGHKLNLSNNIVRSGVAGGAGIKVSGNVSNARTARVGLYNNDVVMTGTDTQAYFINAGSSAGLGSVEIVGGTAYATYQCVGTSIGMVVGGTLNISDVKCIGSCASAMISLSGVSGIVLLKDLTLDMANIAAGASGVDIDTTTNIHIDGLTLMNKTSGSGKAMVTTDTQGTMRGVNFINVASGNRLTGTKFGGGTAPDWTADQGAFVQNLNAANSSGSVVTGHSNDDGASTWTTRTVVAT